MKQLLFILCFLFSTISFSQTKKGVTPAAPADDFASHFEGLKYRNIGPARGGRSTAVAGIPSKPYTFFLGSTGGGVWKTDDGGNSWNNITDGFLPVGSIGSIRVSLSDPNVIYVGTGSADPRGNVSTGKGMFKSTDGGKTWVSAGLSTFGQIGRIEIHPQNPDLVFAAVLGNVFGPNPERGVFRTKDGGKTWEKVLFVNDKTGAMDLVMDPNNPRILFASFWTVQRLPWTMIDGSADGGVWQSKDGGDTWKKLEGGLPKGVLGKIGVAVSPANSDRVWVLLEAQEETKGGLYRSDDGGNSFSRINDDRELRTRHWYYTHIFADPKNPDKVYVNNVNFWKSTDGGNHFSSIPVLHGDNHDLWINPNNPDIFIHSNDGGAHVTFNGGHTWSSLFNQPTSEFYRVEVDNSFPYRVYGCQQDNSSISVTSAPRGGSSYMQDWITWGGESGYVAVDPRNSNIIYSGNYTGIIERYDVAKGHSRTITHYPQLHDGLPLYKVKYRYQWNAPIRISPNNPDVIYHCSQYVHKTTDGGQTWQVISPDLTLNKKEHQELPGGPIQHDYTGVENFNTIFAFEESKIEPDVLWAGSDDGLVHVSRDGGKNWKNVTPVGVPKYATVNTIDLSTFKKGKAYVTVQNYRQNDFKPYIFKTEDYGATWTTITNGIPADHFTRVVREDPNREGLLYGGTEFGMFISSDDGKNWQAFQLNLPHVPITDLLIKNKDLVIATQGRSFWILDDLSTLHQWKNNSDGVVLFAPRTAYRTQLGGFYGKGAPTPAPMGASIHFYFKEKPDSAKAVKIEILDTKQTVQRVFSTKADEKKKETKLEVSKGMNRLQWDLTFKGPDITSGTILAYGYKDGPAAPTGTYSVRLTYDGKTFTQTFKVDKDPRWTATDADLQAQYDLSKQAMDELNRAHLEIRQMRAIKTQVDAVLAKATKAGKDTELKKLADALKKKLTDLEEELIQTKNKAGQDPINYPPMFDDQLDWLYLVVNSQDAKPTDGCYELYRDLKKQGDGFANRLNEIISVDLKAFNDQVLKDGMGVVTIQGID
jgi:photosystem II stability/assembly factor-like uncharacterized protein